LPGQQTSNAGQINLTGFFSFPLCWQLSSLWLGFRLGNHEFEL